MTHLEALELKRVPKHLIVLGGGYVGLELAQAMRRFGAKVTVIDHRHLHGSVLDEHVHAMVAPRNWLRRKGHAQ